MGAAGDSPNEDAPSFHGQLCSLILRTRHFQSARRLADQQAGVAEPSWADLSQRERVCVAPKHVSLRLIFWAARPFRYSPACGEFAFRLLTNSPCGWVILYTSRLWVFSGTLFFPASLKSRDPSNSHPLKPPRRTARKGQQQLDGMGNQRPLARSSPWHAQHVQPPLPQEGHAERDHLPPHLPVSTASRIASRDPPADATRQARTSRVWTPFYPSRRHRRVSSRCPHRACGR